MLTAEERIEQIKANLAALRKAIRAGDAEALKRVPRTESTAVMVEVVIELAEDLNRQLDEIAAMASAAQPAPRGQS